MMASGPATLSAAASTGERTVVLVLAMLGRRQSYETSVAEEEEEKRAQVDLVGRGDIFGGICGVVGLSVPTWRMYPGAPGHCMFALHLGWI